MLSITELSDRQAERRRRRRLTTGAAMAYQEGSDERQRALADALSNHAAAEMGRSEARSSGTHGRDGGRGCHERSWSARLDAP